MQAGTRQWGAVALAAFRLRRLVTGGADAVSLSGAPLLIAVASGLVVNLRMAVYSAAIAPRIAGATRKERLLWGGVSGGPDLHLERGAAPARRAQRARLCLLSLAARRCCGRGGF